MTRVSKARDVRWTFSCTARERRIMQAALVALEHIDFRSKLKSHEITNDEINQLQAKIGRLPEAL